MKFIEQRVEETLFFLHYIPKNSFSAPAMPPPKMLIPPLSKEDKYFLFFYIAFRKNWSSSMLRTEESLKLFAPINP